MNIEQRLLQAFEEADRVEPSDDLWLRVVHSIDEDRAHRRRVVRTMVALVAGVAALVGALVLSVEEGDFGRHVPWQRLEVIEVVALVGLVAVLGPAIRRFGRNFATDLLPSTPATAPALLRLLDIAYWLVATGYMLVTARFGASSPDLLADQLAESAVRIAGMLLALGVLHGVTLIVLPVMALVHNSTQQGRKLPRWITVLLVLMGLALLAQLPNLIAGLIIAGPGG